MTNKPVAKTPDVREDIAKLMMDRDYEFGECCKEWGSPGSEPTMEYYRRTANKIMPMVI